MFIPLIPLGLLLIHLAVQSIAIGIDKNNGDSVGDRERIIEEVDTTIAHYRQEVGKIRIGDSKDTVLSVLTPTQLRSEWQKPPQSYDEGEHLLEIYYFRTNFILDNRTTDDEFTPYIFRDGILVSIGWRWLGGPDTFGGMTH